MARGGDDSLTLWKISAAFKLSAQALYCPDRPTLSVLFDTLYRMFAEGFYTDLIRVNFGSGSTFSLIFAPAPFIFQPYTDNVLKEYLL